MALTCKNCGGNISFDRDTYKITCDSCGTKQSLSDAFENTSGDLIYKDDEASKELLSTYKRALSMMSCARSEKSFRFAADLFGKIPDFLNSEALAKECLEKENLLKTERIYNDAVTDMKSDDPDRIERAIKAFESIGNYKDSSAKTDECKPLLSVAKENRQKRLKEEEEKRISEEKERKRKIQRNKFFLKVSAVTAVALMLILIIVHFNTYSASNIKISLSPDSENYLTEKYNDYVFCYDATIENKGPLDVSSVEGEIIFEKDGEILVDTSIDFYNYSSAVVRSKKSSKYTWELTVYSYDTALALYETDFDDLDVKINITSITYTNGKRKDY